jgi:hypothetical protein
MEGKLMGQHEQDRLTLHGTYVLAAVAALGPKARSSDLVSHLKRFTHRQYGSEYGGGPAGTLWHSLASLEASGRVIKRMLGRTDHRKGDKLHCRYGYTITPRGRRDLERHMDTLSALLVENQM